MPEVYKTLGADTVGSAAYSIYTVPAGKQAIVKRVSLVPPAAGLAAVRLWANQPMTGYFPLAAGEWAEWEGSLTLYSNEFIQVQGGQNASFVVSGVEITP